MIQGTWDNRNNKLDAHGYVCEYLAEGCNPPTTTIVAHAVQTISAPNLPTNSENPLTTTMYIPATSPTDGAIVSNQPTSTPQDDRATSTLAVISPTRPEQSSTSAASASEAQTQQPPVAPDNCTYSGIWRGLHVHLLLAFNI